MNITSGAKISYFEPGAARMEERVKRSGAEEPGYLSSSSGFSSLPPSASSPSSPSASPPSSSSSQQDSDSSEGPLLKVKQGREFKRN